MQKRKRVAKTPIFLQMQAIECGAVTLQIVLGFHGKWITGDEARVACRISRDGCRAIDIVRAARDYGMEACGIKMEPQELCKIKAPAILHWRLTHFVVFEGSLNNDTIRINDPNLGRRIVKKEEIEREMSGVVILLKPGDRFSKGGKRRSVLNYYARALKGFYFACFAVAMSGALLIIPQLSLPILSRVIINNETNLLNAKINQYASLAVVLSIAYLIAIASIHQAISKLSQNGIVKRSGFSFFQHMFALPLEYFFTRNPGELSSRFQTAMGLPELLVGEVAVSALDFILFGIVTTMMVKHSLTLALGCLLLTIIFFVICFFAGEKIDQEARLLAREEDLLNGTALWGFEIFEVLKSSGSETDLFNQWSRQSAKMIDLKQKVRLFSARVNVMAPLLSSVNSIFILGVGGLEILHGSLSVGALAVFQTLSLILTTLGTRLSNLLWRIQCSKGKADLIDDVLLAHKSMLRHSEIKKNKETASVVVTTKLDGSISIKDVGYSYSYSERLTIAEISLKIKPGSKLFIIGTTGSGKSTLARIIGGLFPQKHGYITYSDLKRENISNDKWYASVSFVDQNLFLFEGSISENIRLWDYSISEESIWSALADVELIDEVNFRGGLNAHVAESGVNWSGGQLQRLEIARALVNNPSILILDEATSGLDIRTEYAVMQNIRRRGCTCIVIAHRLSILEPSDEILVLENGRIIEYGTHENLLKQQPGIYSKLAALDYT
jgi:ABC-type bacteriocin/lantibiotic exporter with double-glycine peptidase domain